MIADAMRDVAAAVRVGAMWVHERLIGRKGGIRVRIVAGRQQVDGHVKELPGERREDQPAIPSVRQPRAHGLHSATRGLRHTPECRGIHALVIEL